MFIIVIKIKNKIILLENLESFQKKIVIFNQSIIHTTKRENSKQKLQVDFFCVFMNSCVFIFVMCQSPMIWYQYHIHWYWKISKIHLRYNKYYAQIFHILSNIIQILFKHSFFLSKLNKKKCFWFLSSSNWMPNTKPYAHNGRKSACDWKCERDGENKNNIHR